MSLPFSKAGIDLAQREARDKCGPSSPMAFAFDGAAMGLHNGLHNG